MRKKPINVRVFPVMTAQIGLRKLGGESASENLVLLDRFVRESETKKRENQSDSPVQANNKVHKSHFDAKGPELNHSALYANTSVVEDKTLKHDIPSTHPPAEAGSP